jgi:Co/Zn/Cd efflux system component
MDECCAVRPIYDSHRRALQVVLWINAAMFLAELTAGLVAHSTALIADSVDMLGDAIVYGFSLYVIGRGPEWQARGALLKGGIMAAFGVGVLVEVVANGSVLALLSRHRGDDINMRSAWLCSRNDVIANAGVLVAALGVGLTGSAWPDILIGLAIAALFALSAVGVIRHALAAAQPAR